MTLAKTNRAGLRMTGYGVMYGVMCPGPPDLLSEVRDTCCAKYTKQTKQQGKCASQHVLEIHYS